MNQRPFRLVLLFTLLLAATSPLACGDHGGGKPTGTSSGTGAVLPANTDPAKGRDPITTQGGSVALFPDETRVVVADEDHEVLFLGPTDLSSNDIRMIAMPGPPEQVVALDGFVFVTVRTLPTDAAKAVHETIRGPIPTGETSHGLSDTKLLPPVQPEGGASSAPSASAAPSAQPSAPPVSRPSSSASASPKASASASASASPKAAPHAAKRGTPPLTIDPSVARQSRGGLLVALRTDPKEGLVEVGRLTLAPDAWGLALTPDRKRAVVTSAWAAEVSVVDITDPTAMKVVSHEKVAREPRGVAIAPDGKTAFISHLVGAALTRIDDLDGAPKASAQALPAALARAIPSVEASASLGYALVLAPDGKTLYVPRHALGAQGIGSWWGAPTVDALDVPSGKPLQPARVAASPQATIEGGNVMPGPEWKAQAGLPPSGATSLLEPRAVVYRKSTQTLLVASEGSDAVTELGTRVPDPAMDVRSVLTLGNGYDLYGDYPTRGGAPTGLALNGNESQLFVWCRSTFDLARIDLETGAVAWYHVADDGLPTDAAYGRRLFMNASSSTISGGLACAACHPDGREDGYVWRAALFDAEKEERFIARRELLKLNGGPFGMTITDKPAVYARQTPMLAGRVRADGPYGWHGQNKDLLDRLIEGFHLHRPSWETGQTDKSIGQDVAKIDYLADFIRSGLIPPPTLVHDLDATERKGKALYEGSKTNCTSCHLGDGGSDRKVVQLAALPTRAGFDAEPDQRFKVPSLTFVGGTAPYFHDGSAATLEDLIRANGQRMGDTSQLTVDEQTALVAYLRTL